MWNCEVKMKEIKAIIQPHMLTKVIDSLKAMKHLPGITVSEVRGFGHIPPESAKNKIVEEFIEYARKTKIEIIVPDELAEQVVDAIARNAHTGLPGDGLIFVSPVDEVIKIRTGDRTREP
jgi:nitrogen regulatory protein P-II 1